MKRELLAGVVALGLFGGGQALAQAVIEISPDQRTTIREYVVKEKVRPMTTRERITVGTTLPEDVELHTVPSAWGAGLTRYRYVYHGDDVVLVEPGSRRVVQIIE